jgi:hypothetical protein
MVKIAQFFRSQYLAEKVCVQTQTVEVPLTWSVNREGKDLICSVKKVPVIAAATWESVKYVLNINNRFELMIKTWPSWDKKAEEIILQHIQCVSEI